MSNNSSPTTIPGNSSAPSSQKTKPKPPPKPKTLRLNRNTVKVELSPRNSDRTEQRESPTSMFDKNKSPRTSDSSSPTTEAPTYKILKISPSLSKKNPLLSPRTALREEINNGEINYDDLGKSIGFIKENSIHDLNLDDDDDTENDIDKQIIIEDAPEEGKKKKPPPPSTSKPMHRLSSHLNNQQISKPINLPLKNLPPPVPTTNKPKTPRTPEVPQTNKPPSNMHKMKTSDPAEVPEEFVHVQECTGYTLEKPEEIEFMEIEDYLQITDTNIYRFLYNDLYFEKKHKLYFVMEKNNDAIHVVALSAHKDPLDSSHNLLILSKTGYKPTKASANKKMRRTLSLSKIKDMMITKSDETPYPPLNNLKIALHISDTEWIELNESQHENLTKKLQHFETRLKFRHYKFGLIYISPGQTDEDIIYQNQEYSPAFKTFMEQMGTIITLKGKKKIEKNKKKKILYII